MARVLVSFLGTSDYVSCNYQLGAGSVCNVRFVQTALVGLICRDWDSGDGILVGCTEKARKTNFAALQQEMRNRTSALPRIEAVDVPEALSEQEMWVIFERLTAEVQENDELVFDITHAFRSLPLLFTVLIQYLGVVVGG